MGTISLTPSENGSWVGKDEAGKELKFVAESDLLAVKSGREGLETKVKQMEETHKVAVSTVEQKLFATEAKVTELQEKLTQGNLSATELVKVKAELATAQQRSGELETKALEYQKRIIAQTYQIPIDTLKDKTMEQLGHYEEALKAVTANLPKGGGGYAAGAGGAGVTAETPMDRAKRIIATQEERQGKVRVSGSGVPAGK